MAFKTASAAQVREFAQENGFKVGSRGRFSTELVKAFNKAHRGTPYREGKHVPTVRVTVKPEKGRAVTRSINIAEVRRAAQEQGVPVASRGIIPESVINAYVLGTLSTLSVSEQPEVAQEG